MKECKDIQNNLPLYLDDSLSAADKKSVEEHLKICPQCKKTLSQLRKTEAWVSSVQPVDTPPRFRQEIMAKVREEAEKKSFVQKWFYPLQIKIPVQIFATVCIAVLAVYIYRAGEEQMKEVVPSSAPAPVVEVQKSPLSEQKTRTSTDTKDIQQEYQSKQTGTMQKESVAASLSDAAGDVKPWDAKEIKADKYESAPAMKSPELPEPSLERKKEMNLSGAVMKTSRAPQAQSLVTKPNVLLKVSDIDIAAKEAEKLLRRYEARIVTRQIMPDKILITAQLKNEKVKDFLTRLNKISPIEESVLPVADTEGNVSIVMEIINN